MEYFKILYTFSRKIQINCLNLKNCRKKILNFVEYFEKEFPINDFDFYLLHCSKINFFKIIYVNNCSCIIKEIFYIHFLNNETSSFKKCFMFDLFYFFFQPFPSSVITKLPPIPPPNTRTYMKTYKKNKIFKFNFLKNKTSNEKNFQIQFSNYFSLFQSEPSPFFFSFCRSY